MIKVDDILLFKIEIIIFYILIKFKFVVEINDGSWCYLEKFLLVIFFFSLECFYYICFV